MKPQLGQATRQRIGPSGRAELHLLACCPRMPTDVVATLLRMRRARSAAQLLLRLGTVGLAQYETVRPGPLVGSRVVRLWTLTTAGQTVLTSRGLAPSEKGRSQLPYGRPARWRDVARQRDVPMLVVAYRLLAYVVRELDGPVRVAAWEHPWIRTLVQTETGRVRHLRLPAAAALIQDDVDGGSVQRLLLLPDVGTIPVASYRPVLRGLTELRQASDTDAKDEALLIVGVAAAAGSDARTAAWHSLLQQVARREGEQPLRARVFASTEGLVSRSRSGNQVEQAFGLLARHPLLTRQQLAMLLDTSQARAGRLLVQLTAYGWVSAIQSGEVPPDAHGLIPGQQRRLALVELTPAGRREAARRLLLAATVAARHHGLLGKGAITRRFLRHLAHTLGANAVFAAFVSAARRVTERGGNDALEEWRSAAACASGSFRPDGYGCYRRGQARYGFFIEYDRGTERAHEYAAKLAAYYRYRDRGAAALGYAGFPTVLVVTTQEAAEFRFAHEAHVGSEKHAGKPLPILFTRTDVIEANQDGILGPIWRTPGRYGEPPSRAYWLPGGPPKGSFSIMQRQVSRGD